MTDRRDPSDAAMPASPRVDWRRVGAGAGSVVFLDRNGQLAVGMEGAGAAPGPIVFGRGGDRPTITDAQVILGRLDPQKLPGLDTPLTQAALRALFERGIARPLRQEPEALAASMLGLFEARLVAGIRVLCTELQKDPKTLTLFVSGGAGAMHGTAIARELGIRKMLVPARPGLTRALGCLVADLRQDFVLPLNVPLAEFDLDAAEAEFERQAAQGRATLAPRGSGGGAGFGIETVEVEHAVMLQIEGEPMPRRVVQAESRPRLSSLHAELEQARSLRRKGPEPVARVVAIRTAVIGRRPALQLMGLMAPQQRKPTLEDAKIGVRPVWFGSSFVQCPVYSREAIPITAGFIGPAIIEQMDATVVIDPLMHVTADEQGNLVVHVR